MNFYQLPARRSNPAPQNVSLWWRRATPVFVALLIATCTTCQPIEAFAADGLDWHPEQTWVFAVGVLEYQHPEVWRNQPAAKKGRRDDQLVEHFARHGVAQDHIVYLRDREATQQRIRHALAEQLKRTRPGDLLVLYYTGHGSRDHKTRSVHFVNYDAKDGPTAWPVTEIVETVDAGFQGDKALLIADCCYSGALADEIRRHDRKKHFACLCSSYSHNSSTGNWTFSDALLKGLRGKPAVDLNADGQIAFSEIANYAELDMGFIEKQKSVSIRSKEFPEHWKVARTEGRFVPRLGERAEILWQDKWYRGQIINVEDATYQIHYVNYNNSWDEWVTADRIRPYRPHEFPQGTKVDAFWPQDKKWYPAEVRRGWYGLHLVHYDGYSEEYDDWVPPDNIRARR